MRKDKLFMIKDICFTKEYLDKFYKNDLKRRKLLERVIYAFYLLELVNDYLDVFKGGTSLMVLNKSFDRFSTDIDITMPLSDYDDIQLIIDDIQKNQNRFIKVEEDIRESNNTSIIKKHFIFHYQSLYPSVDSEEYVLLDIVFQENFYSNNYQKITKIKNIEFDDNPLTVFIPNKNEMIGDKLGAVGPTTIGIQYNKNKDVEIIKQIHDVSSLLEKNHYDIKAVANIYDHVSKNQNEYRDLHKNKEDFLNDAFSVCKAVLTFGKYDPRKEYNTLIKAYDNFTFYLFKKPNQNQLYSYCLNCIILIIDLIIYYNYQGKMFLDDAFVNQFNSQPNLKQLELYFDDKKINLLKEKLNILIKS